MSATTTPFAELLGRLGDVPPDRVRQTPEPGTATLDDLIRANAAGPVCEWVEGTLVEKAMGWYESWVAAELIRVIGNHVAAANLGMLLGADGVLRILPGIGRAPDVAFVAWASLPGGPPARDDRVPELVPDLAVEVLSTSNTRREMARKRGEYFRAGVKLVWEIDPETETATAYTAADRPAAVPADGVLDGGAVLPGFTLPLREVFARAAGRRNR